jgi:hypothetical protein
MNLRTRVPGGSLCARRLTGTTIRCVRRNLKSRGGGWLIREKMGVLTVLRDAHQREGPCEEEVCEKILGCFIIFNSNIYRRNRYQKVLLKQIALSSQPDDAGQSKQRGRAMMREGGGSLRGKK